MSDMGMRVRKPRGASIPPNIAGRGRYSSEHKPKPLPSTLDSEKVAVAKLEAMASTDLQTKRDQLRRAFAAAIFAKASALVTLSLTGRERARLRESIASDIRKACDVLASIEVSEA